MTTSRPLNTAEADVLAQALEDRANVLLDTGEDMAPMIAVAQKLGFDDLAAHWTLTLEEEAARDAARRGAR